MPLLAKFWLSEHCYPVKYGDGQSPNEDNIKLSPAHGRDPYFPFPGGTSLNQFFFKGKYTSLNSITQKTKNNTVGNVTKTMAFFSSWQMTLSLFKHCFTLHLKQRLSLKLADCLKHNSKKRILRLTSKNVWGETLSRFWISQKIWVFREECLLLEGNIPISFSPCYLCPRDGGKWAQSTISMS